MAEKPGVMIYFDLLPALQNMSNSDKGLLFQAIVQYAQRPGPVKLNQRLESLWPLIRQRIDSDSNRYYNTVRRKEYAAYVRWAKRNDKAVMDYTTWNESRGEYIESLTYYPNKIDEIRAKFPGQVPDEDAL